MVDTRNYTKLRQRINRIIAREGTDVTFYSRDESWTATGRLAPAGSRSFGRTMQSAMLAGTEVVGRQLSVLVLPDDTQMPEVGDECRTVRDLLEQRFTVVFTIKAPYQLQVLLDESE